MKLEKLDHKHALTSWLKVILFACLMLAPIMSVVIRSLYVVCNKNAKDSYYGETINEKTSTLVDNTNLQTNKIYTLMAYNNNQFTNAYGTNNYILVDNVRVLNNFTDVDLSTCNKIQFYTTQDNKTLFFRHDNTELTRIFINNTEVVCDFTFLSYGENFQTGILPYWDFFYDISYNKDSYLDNVFDYSISQIEESQFYNWTQNTAIYNGVEAMTSGLGITGATVPILITYWFLLTVIYIVIDIVLNLFTYITHYLNKKVE